MFDQFKMMGAVAGLLKNRDGIKAAGERIQARLDELRIEGESEGGLARAVVTGKMQVVSITVSETLASGLGSGTDRSLAEVLIAEAVNDALRQAQVAVTAAIDEEGESLGLPGLGEQLGQILPR
jgi:nucleoid-associated protein EbfC